jgi:hypothetical protein
VWPSFRAVSERVESISLRVPLCPLWLRFWIFRVGLRDKCQGPTSVGSTKSSPPVIPTENRTTEGGEVEWRDPDTLSATMRHQGVLRKQVSPALAKCISRYRLLPSRDAVPNPAPDPDPEQFPCIVLDRIRSCRHTGAGEESAPLQPRVAREVVNGCSPFLVTTPNSVFPTESRTMRLSAGTVEERPFMAAKRSIAWTAL